MFKTLFVCLRGVTDISTRLGGEAVDGMFRIASLCVGVVVLTALFAACPCGAELRAGAAKSDITPDVKASVIPLGGYAARKGAPATGVHDPVYARALVLSNGGDKVGLVSLDLCFMPANIKAEVIKRISAAGVTGLDSDHLLIAATHTHSAPDPLAMHSRNTFAFKGWTSFDAHLLDFTAGKIADAIVQADHRLAPALAGTETFDATGQNRNRRGDKITDPILTLLKVIGFDGHAIGAIVNFAAHPTLYDDDMLEISADWPGVMTGDVEKTMQATGADAPVCLFLNGAEGDASPNGVDGKTSAEKVLTYGHTLGKIASDLLAKVTTMSNPLVRAWTQAVSLPPRKPNALFILAAGQIGLGVGQARNLALGLMPETTHLGFVQVGDLLFMGFPCEPTAPLGLAAKAAARKAGFLHPAVVALANDWLAYALTPEQYHEGKYEAGMSFYGDQFGPTLLKALGAGLAARPR